MAHPHLDDRADTAGPAGQVPLGGPTGRARWPEGVRDVVVARIGVQSEDTVASVKAIARVLELAAGPHGPASVERVSDADGEVVICHWTDPAEHAAWWGGEALREWWSSLPEDGPLGHWHETTTTPVDRLETVRAAQTGAAVSGDLHDDAPPTRLPAFALEELRGVRADDVPTDLPPGASPRGRRVLVTGSPAGLCWTRTAQDLADVPEEQLDAFRQDVEPACRAAVAHLEDDPHGSGCLSARLVHDLDSNGALAPGTEVFAWWRGVGDVLDWARDHRASQEVLKAFRESLVLPFGPELRLALRHEVHVLPEGALAAEYVNCHPGTGLLQTWPG